MKKVQQKPSDESTIFVLAGLMIDIVGNMLSRGTDPEADRRSARIIGNAVKVMNRDPEFLERFHQQQKNVLEEFERLGRKS
jgi:hypothetical protein